MNSFPSEVISFIGSIEPNYTIEPWGLSIEKRGVAFVFHHVTQVGEVLAILPKDLHLIHIWEDLWKKREGIVKSRIISLLGSSERVFARKTKVVKLNKPELLDFLTQHHLNEPANGKHKYGLILGNELVAVAAFSASCPVHRDGVVYKSHQLIRFCNKNGKTVVGGLSKLISYFIKKHEPEDIMSYADLDWSNGKSYSRLGFHKIGLLAPQPFYINLSTMNRLYKLNSLEEKSDLLECMNQGSIKYLLDLKQDLNG